MYKIFPSYFSFQVFWVAFCSLVIRITVHCEEMNDLCSRVTLKNGFKVSATVVRKMLENFHVFLACIYVHLLLCFKSYGCWFWNCLCNSYCIGEALGKVFIYDAAVVTLTASPKSVHECVVQKVVFKSLSISLFIKIQKILFLAAWSLYTHHLIYRLNWTSVQLYYGMLLKHIQNSLTERFAVATLQHLFFIQFEISSLLLHMSMPLLMWMEEEAYIKFITEWLKGSFVSCNSKEYELLCIHLAIGKIQKEFIFQSKPDLNSRTVDFIVFYGA